MTKTRFDKASVRGVVFSTIAALGIIYEILFSAETRPFLIIMYSIVIAIGGLYIFFIEDAQT